MNRRGDAAGSGDSRETARIDGPSEAVASLADRQREAKRRRRRVAGLWVAGAAVLLGLAAAAIFTPVFALTAVSVAGAKRVDEAEVRAQVLDGWRGVPLPRIPVRTVAAQIAKEFPVAASVRVERSWPNGLGVVLTERVPIAAIDDGGGRFSLVDDTGFTVAETGAAPKDLPVLDIDVATAGVDAVKSGLLALAALPPSLVKKLAKVGADGPGSVVLTLDSGQTIRWGDGSQGALKAKVVTALLKDKKIRSIDVTVPGAPTTK